VLGKPVHHIGLNWEELSEISLPSLPLESFQMTQASQGSAAWQEVDGMGRLKAAGLPLCLDRLGGLRSVTQPRHLAAWQ